MNVPQFLEVASSVVVAVVAVAFGVSYFGDRADPNSRRTLDAAPAVPHWEEAIATGIRRGPTGARIVIAEFMDFQCPFCARMKERTDRILAEFPNEVAVVFQHFPLTIHEMAVPAAIAAECAENQGRFWEMADVIFTRQAELELEPWEEFAGEAGIRDMDAFRRCRSMPVDSFPRITKGRELGELAGINATPTTWINGRDMNVSLALVRAELGRKDKP